MKIKGKARGRGIAVSRAKIIALALRTFLISLSLAYDNQGRPMDNTQIDQELRAALYLLGFNFLGGDLLSREIAEIKGNMTIK